MPIYEYVCTACEHELEALQKMSDAPLQDCPQCTEPALKKKISAPGFRLAGSGWYETDFKSDKQRNLADSGEKKASSDNKKSDTKSEKKADSGKSANKSSGKEAAA